MSGLIERIVRRRRATASRRLGPPPQHPAAVNGGPSPWAPAKVNGTHTAVWNGAAATEPELETESEAIEAPLAEPEAIEEPPAEPEAVEEPLAEPDAVEPEAIEEPLAETEAEPEAEPEPEPAAHVDSFFEDDEEPFYEEPETISFPALAAAAAVPEPHEELAEPELAPPDPEPQAELEPQAEPEPQAEAEPEPQAEPEPPAVTTTLRTRGAIRRRVRYLRSLREVQLRDLGGFLVELHRFGVERPELVQAKLDSALRIDRELRALQRSLETDEPLRELREAGIGGACTNCGAVHGSEDRFCASCGEPLHASAAPDPIAPLASPPRPDFHQGQFEA